MSLPAIRRIGRRVTNPDHILTECDSVETAIRVPFSNPDPRFAGVRLRTSQLACNIVGAVGIPASAFLTAGLNVHEDWLAEVRDGKIVRWIGRVFGPQSLWPEDRPAA